MTRKRFRQERLEKAPSTDEIVENREFTEKTISLINKMMPYLSNGQQIVINSILKGKKLGDIAKEYQSHIEREDDLSRISSVCYCAITNLRRYLSPFAKSNDIEIRKEIDLSRFL
ncbi:MAG: hypothetical protein QXS38_00630 [Candidatus Pacearchaeota archaeon]